MKDYTTKDLIVLGIIVIISALLSVVVTLVDIFDSSADSIIDFAVLFTLMWFFYRLGKSTHNGS